MESTSKLLIDSEKVENEAGPAMTYIVAENPEILGLLMRENEKRNPGMYTTPVRKKPV